MDFRAALLEQTDAFGTVIATGDPDTPVPTCPDWTLTHLFRHVGRGNRWAAQIIADRRSDALDPREVRDGKPPADPDAALDWLNGGAQMIVDAVDRVGSARVWTFAGPRPAGWWIRRRLHEVLVHRADAALAVGGVFEVPADLAADAISEWVELMANPKLITDALDRGQTMHLHATDIGLGVTGEWTVVHDEEGISWSHSHGKGDVALRGPARDLLLAVTRRRTATELGLQVFGETAVWDTWLQRTQF
ncbi:maleylpyruvate isomerase family mycothiol-dependent enzyme [Mycolicibacterium arseniciresistens]|uniref:Maleylpyruvate isomerase family mycothiol-dependent enzyme n=1 Tax=Mycolicibacterium arseniciresistens TaxID=3062257 RepID=A0ABT8UMN8_9MYCO|nr:maleylpyruvate isomerase family mycothiol-dependent enzyme [Mycolicibacterium arseniciresistens]MDO3639062.1 maleylpyruvate isomerase family mycothiol-dependent enzyme [Mycolicibacterium arseniciresistens]